MEECVYFFEYCASKDDVVRLETEFGFQATPLGFYAAGRFFSEDAVDEFVANHEFLGSGDNESGFINRFHEMVTTMIEEAPVTCYYCSQEATRGNNTFCEKCADMPEAWDPTDRDLLDRLGREEREAWRKAAWEARDYETVTELDQY